MIENSLHLFGPPNGNFEQARPSLLAVRTLAELRNKKAQAELELRKMGRPAGFDGGRYVLVCDTGNKCVKALSVNMKEARAQPLAGSFRHLR